MSIFDAHYLFLFLSYYSLQVLSEVLLCMLLCERKAVSRRIFSFVHDFKSQCWMEEDEEEEGGVFTWQEEERARMSCDARRQERRGVWVMVRQGESGWVGGGASGPQSLYGRASVIWVISALCLCGRRGDHQSYQMKFNLVCLDPCGLIL